MHIPPNNPNNQSPDARSSGTQASGPQPSGTPSPAAQLHGAEPSAPEPGRSHGSGKTPTKQAAPTWLLNAIVLGFVGMQVALGIRSLALEDSRLGWGMFSYQTNYTVSYEWVLADGTTRKQPALGLAGRTIKYCGDQFMHRTRYGRGAIRCWMRSYLHYLCSTHQPADAVAARAVVRYRINKQGDWESIVVQVPEVTTS